LKYTNPTERWLHGKRNDDSKLSFPQFNSNKSNLGHVVANAAESQKRKIIVLTEKEKHGNWLKLNGNALTLACKLPMSYDRSGEPPWSNHQQTQYCIFGAVFGISNRCYILT